MSFAASVPLPTVLFSAFAVLAVAGCGVSIDLGDETVHRTEQSTVGSSGVRRVVITTDNGDVDVTTGTGDIDVRALISESDEGDADYTVDVDGDTLTVSGVCDGDWLGRCEVGFRVVLPAALDVTVETDNGEIDVSDLAGRLDVSTDNGEIDAAGLSGSSVVARTDNGDIGLRFTDVPDRVSASSDNGAIVVELPDSGEQYDVDASSDNGDVRVDVSTDRETARSVDVSSDNGDVIVRHPAG